MDTEYTISTSNLQSLANAIRSKTGESDPLTVAQMTDAVENLTQTLSPIEELTLTGDEPKVILDNESESGSVTLSSSGLEIKYTDSLSNESSISFTGDGFVDIIGLRRPVELDCTDWPEPGGSGVIYETLEGLNDPIAYTVAVAADESSITFSYNDGISFVVSLPQESEPQP